MRDQPGQQRACFRVSALLLAGCVVYMSGCGRGDRPVAKTEATTDGSQAVSNKAQLAQQHAAEDSGPAPFLFLDAAETQGVDFVHQRGPTAELYFPTSNGSGVAAVDYDQDGWLDIVFVDGGPLAPDNERPISPLALYRNDGERFERVDARMPAFESRGYGQGIAAGDVDNDGFPDLYVTTSVEGRLFHNNGDGTFQPLTDPRQAAIDAWLTGAAFCDYDADGNTDLYVASYGQWSMATHRRCTATGSDQPLYCNPTSIPPARHFLLRGDGAGGFEDRTRQAGVFREDGRGLGVIATDLNTDRRIDLFVANDICPNFMFLNRGDGAFTDATHLSGTAFTVTGSLISGMGVDVADLNGDQRPEILVTNYHACYNVLFQSEGEYYRDITPSTPMAAETLAYLGWAVGLRDFDNDGAVDVLVVNGKIDQSAAATSDAPFTLAEPSQIWHNRGAGRLKQATDISGSFFAAPRSGRGAAFGDFDNDGRCDLVVSNWGERASIGLNRSPQPERNWLRLDLVGRTSSRDAVGALVTFDLAGQRRKVCVNGGGSYLSANDPRLHFGLGNHQAIEDVVIEWPSGQRDTIESLAANREHRIVEPLLISKNVP